MRESQYCEGVAESEQHPNGPLCGLLRRPAVDSCSSGGLLDFSPRIGHVGSMAIETILTAMVDDDRTRVRELLKANPILAKSLIAQARLYQSKIVHWIYAGDTALHLAAAGHRVELVRLLLAAGAEPNSAKNHRQSGPLHYAADGYIKGADWDAKRQVKTIQCLLAAGAHINAQDKNGATPLHRAVRTRCAAAVKCLLESGSDATLKNKPG